MEIFLLILRLFLAGVFLIAGIGKLLDLKGSEKAVKDFGVPQDLAKAFGTALPVVEIIIAVLLLFISTSWFGAISGTLLLLTFISGMLWQMKLGNAPDCHCFGQIHSEPVGKKSLLRNIIFAFAGMILILSGKDNQGYQLTDSIGDFTYTMQVFFGLLLIGFLIVLFLYLKKIIENQTQILRRLEVLEIIGNNGGNIQERENVGDPTQGLPIGSPLPNFQMPTANGQVLTLEQLLARKKPILFFNVSPTCNPCQALLPEIEKWEKELSNQITFIFISNGSIKDNLAKFNSEYDREILIQDDKELADLMEIRWTPTALLANSKGMIASHPAAGDIAIRELINDIKSKNLDDEFVYVAKENQKGDMPKIGENVPEFSLEDIRGKSISTNDLKGKKTLVAFWSMTCPHCEAMIDELSDWDKIKGQDEPNLIVFSDGEPKEHENLRLNSPIVLDKDYKVSDKLGMFGTPSAILIDESGKIISETAIGAGQIWALIGRRTK